MNRMCGLPAADTLLTLPIMDASAMVRPTTPNIVAGERHEYSIRQPCRRSVSAMGREDPRV